MSDRRAFRRRLFFAGARHLHGPDALDKDLLRAVERAAYRLKAGDALGAQRQLDALGLSELSHDGAALMKAVADHFGVKPVDLPPRASMRTWNAQDIALHLPIFKRHLHIAQALAKGAIPFDPQKHPRWPAGTPDRRGGEFAPSNESGASVIPVASRGNGGPPKGKGPAGASTPKPQTSAPDEPGVRFIEPGDFPEGINSSSSPQPKLVGPDDLRPGIGHNSGNPRPLDAPPELPTDLPQGMPPDLPVQPLSDKARYLFIKMAVRWIARALILAAAPDLAPYLVALQVSYWVGKACWPYIKAYFDPPKTFEELQANALKPEKGYDIHHPVEQTQAVREGYPKELSDGPGNRVRIPTLKHWLITGWYMSKNLDPKYGGLSPRAYLKREELGRKNGGWSRSTYQIRSAQTVKKIHLAAMSVDELVDRFAEISVQQDDAVWAGKYAKYNRLYDQIELIDKELKARGTDARSALLRLYNYPNIQARLAAAVRTLAVAPEKARYLLQWIADSRLYPQAADASMLLDSLDNGTFKPE